MPTWATTTNDEKDEILDQIVTELNHEVSTDPSFENVIGISKERIMLHAMHAVMAHSKDSDLKSAHGLTHLYIMGFIVGTKYGRLLERGEVPQTGT